jgi:hypothetical protein
MAVDQQLTNFRVRCSQKGDDKRLRNARWAMIAQQTRHERKKFRREAQKVEQVSTKSLVGLYDIV